MKNNTSTNAQSGTQKTTDFKGMFAVSKRLSTLAGFVVFCVPDYSPVVG